MPFIGGSAKAPERITSSVQFTEEYQDRIKSLLGAPSHPAVSHTVPSIRGILLQDTWGGAPGVLQLLGRNALAQSFLVQIVGQNLKNSPSAFRLFLEGAPDPNMGPWSSIGASSLISFNSTAVQFAQATDNISPLLNTSNYAVTLGNPYISNELFFYPPVVIPVLPTDVAQSFIGAWYIAFDPLVFYGRPFLRLSVLYDNTTFVSSLSDVVITQLYEDLLPNAIPVIDTHYRTQDYPWQAGTIVTATNYDGVGYCISSASFRTLTLV